MMIRRETFGSTSSRQTAWVDLKAQLLRRSSESVHVDTQVRGTRVNEAQSSGTVAVTVGIPSGERREQAFSDAFPICFFKKINLSHQLESSGSGQYWHLLAGTLKPLERRWEATERQKLSTFVQLYPTTEPGSAR
eukprot:689080-Rhodomonas_salina.1